MNAVDLSTSVEQCIRETAGHRCGYCLSQQKYVMGKLEIEHIIPRARDGSDDESNLWLSCSLCNRYKGPQIAAVDPLTGATVPLFNPRTQSWNEHFYWGPDGTLIIGLTSVGRTTVEAL